MTSMWSNGVKTSMGSALSADTSPHDRPGDEDDVEDVDDVLEDAERSNRSSPLVHRPPEK